MFTGRPEDYSSAASLDGGVLTLFMSLLFVTLFARLDLD